MVELIKSALLAVSALIPIVNPLGSSPFFLSLTDEYAAAERQELARRIALNSLCLLIGSYLLGAHILAFFGISLPVVQVGGGLIVISAGWSMLQKGDEEKKEREAAHRNVDRAALFRKAFYPLTLPLTVGPGSISVAITLGANVPHHSFLVVGGGIIGLAITALTIYLCYGSADRLARMLGPAAMSVIARLSSFLLVCIGVQIVWNGVEALLASPHRVR